jgi:phosphoribosylformylglycinamidine synthase
MLHIVYSTVQVGDACPDVDPVLLGAAFKTTQNLIAEGRLLAGHDISDGGIATAVSQLHVNCLKCWHVAVVNDSAFTVCAALLG